MVGPLVINFVNIVILITNHLPLYTIQLFTVTYDFVHVSDLSGTNENIVYDLLLFIFWRLISIPQ